MAIFEVCTYANEIDTFFIENGSQGRFVRTQNAYAPE